MDKHQLMGAAIRNAVSRGQVSGSPFVDYANDAYAIFSGFRVVAQLLQDDLILAACEGEEDRTMDDNQKDALIGMIRAASWAMELRASDIRERADRVRERIEERAK